MKSLRLSPLALAVVAACTTESLDLPVAPEATPPVIEKVEPDRAFAGTRLVLRGRGFDPRADANEVQFADRLATPVAATAETLEVLVPDDAGGGSLFVTSGGRRSGPAKFTYRGLGHPRRGMETGRAIIGYDFGWMGVVSDALFGWSGRFGALVDVRRDHPVVVPFETYVAPVPLPDGRRLLVRKADATWCVLDPSDPSLQASGPSFPDGTQGTFLRSTAGSRPPLWRWSWAGSGGSAEGASTLQRIDPDTFADVGSAVSLQGAYRVVPFDDHRAFVARGDQYAGWRLVDADGGTDFAPRSLELVGGLAIDPLAGGAAYGWNAVEHAVVRLSREPTPTVELLPTAVHLEAVSEGLVARGSGGAPIVVLALPSESLVVALDGETGVLRWSSTAAEEPNALAFDEATGVVYVANHASSNVFGLDLATGSVVSRSRLHAPLGASDLYGPGLGLARGWVGAQVEFLLSTGGILQTSFVLDSRKLVVRPLATPVRSDAFFQASDDEAYGYDASTRTLYPIDQTRGGPIVDLGADPEVVVRTPSGLFAVASRGLEISIITPDNAVTTWTDVVPEDARGSFQQLRAMDDGRWVAVRRDFETPSRPAAISLIEWAPGALEQGGAPARRVAHEGCTTGYAVPGGFELVCETSRRRVYDDLSDGPVLTGGEAISQTSGPSPDGRVLLKSEWLGFSLSSITPGEQLVELGRFEAPESIESWAFSEDGETLLVVSGDTIIRIE